jgi:O-antigen ligase
MEIDYNLFLDNPLLGVGVGMSESMHKMYGYQTAAFTHTEFTRLLAEQGVFGLFALILLLLLPLLHFIKTKNSYNRVIMIFLIGFSFLTMVHEAMRLAMVGFAFGLAFINFVKDEED